MIISYSVGAAAIVTGGVLYWLGRRSAAPPSRETVSWSPVVGPGGAGVEVHGGIVVDATGRYVAEEEGSPCCARE
jgi:hypothetical protein